MPLSSWGRLRTTDVSDAERASPGSGCRRSLWRPRVARKYAGENQAALRT